VVRTANRDDAIGKRENARRVWDECVPLKDSPGADYLRLRQCALPPDDGDLRFHPALRCGELDQKFPALIGKVTTVQGEIFVGIHRVWFRPGVAKAAKKMRLGGSDQPVCIRLWPDDLVTTGLGIAEGIETALAAATMFRPMWSTIDAGQMASFPVLRGIESLTIFADNDASGTGLKAAQTCATTWMKAGVQVRVLLPKILGEDANDVVRRISGVQS
jgi:hypothetical protein